GIRDRNVTGVQTCALPILLVIIAALAAFGWHWVAVDPGFVLVKLRGWEVQSTLLTAVIIVVVAVLIVVWAWLLLRWSIGAAGRRSGERRVGKGSGAGWARA